MRNRFCFKIVVAVIAFLLGLNFVNSADAAKLRRTGSDSQSEKNYRINRPVLPKEGTIAVIVEGSNQQHIAMAEAMIVEELVSNGYKVVDDARMARMRSAAIKSRAAYYAFQGNTSELLKLNGKYNASATIVARISAGVPVVNEFKLFTATSSAAMIAVTSKGEKLGGKTAQGKSVGYTPEEAQQNAVNSAVQEAISQMF